MPMAGHNHKSLLVRKLWGSCGEVKKYFWKMWRVLCHFTNEHQLNKLYNILCIYQVFIFEIRIHSSLSVVQIPTHCYRSLTDYWFSIEQNDKSSATDAKREINKNSFVRDKFTTSWYSKNRFIRRLLIAHFSMYHNESFQNNTFGFTPFIKDYKENHDTCFANESEIRKAQNLY